MCGNDPVLSVASYTTNPEKPARKTNLKTVLFFTFKSFHVLFFTFKSFQCPLKAATV